MSSDISKFELRRLNKIVKKILSYSKEVSEYSDNTIGSMTTVFRERLDNGETLDDILPLAFCVCSEAIYRTTGKRLYNVQLMGGIVLHQGRLAEMKTGEGKTLTEICPAYLNAIEEKGVHIITVNDYLAQRDYEEMHDIFNFLGMSVGLIIEGTNRRDLEYNSDITYTTNSQLGFDYLKDNIVYDLNYKVQRELNYVIIDEVDSVLIDEAQTPLIISNPSTGSSGVYLQLQSIIASLDSEDYLIDRTRRSINLTTSGIDKINDYCKVDITELDNIDLLHYSTQLLRSNYLMVKGKDYVVKGDEVIIVDQSTGRLADGRRFSDGLHQAIEVKEGLEAKKESTTIASITYPNFFKLYNKVSGMSGTIATEGEEFKTIYQLDVVPIPTNKRIQRIDNEDILVGSLEEKYRLLTSDISENSKKGRPILVCSQSINTSIQVSSLLTELGIKHYLLNANSQSEEADIISKAGQVGAITVATNMAGRGTDIKLSEEAIKLGGLKVIGTERNPELRVDNQLIGRAGRQGQPGESQFYISLEDSLFEDNSIDYITKLIKPYIGKSITISKSKILNTTKKVQRYYSSQRRLSREDSVKYDEVLNQIRKSIYETRDRLLLTFTNGNVEKLGKFLFDSISMYIDTKFEFSKEDDYEFNLTYFEELDEYVKYDSLEDVNHLIGTYHTGEFIRRLLITKIIDYINIQLQSKEFDEVIGFILGSVLFSLDTVWIKYLTKFELIKLEVVNQSYAQRDPAVMYKYLAKNSYDELEKEFSLLSIKSLFEYLDTKLNIQ